MTEVPLIGDPTASGAHSSNGKAMFFHQKPDGAGIQRLSVGWKDFDGVETELLGGLKSGFKSVPEDERAAFGLRD